MSDKDVADIRPGTADASGITFDHTLLPDAAFEFVIISDTHYMQVPKSGRVEFSSRLTQSARSEVARALIAALDVPLIVHLGDLVQEFPGSPNFNESRERARALWTALDADVKWVSGNHDVGDKPDPTLVDLPIRREWLDEYHEWFGTSWYSFDAGGYHFVILNGQLFNAELPQEAEQFTWLEADLQSNAGRPTLVFVHMPPYIFDVGEPGLGHYDNISEPARGRLVELLESHRVEWVFSGHVHFSFYDRRGATRYLTVLSPAFTRPGFPHIFTSAAPPERGRDDTGKLGFYLARATAAGLELHLIRTGGATSVVQAPGMHGAQGTESDRLLLTRTTRSLPESPVGISLIHPLSAAGQVPLVWPSAVRQPARNDYPLLAILEAGVRYARATWQDLDDSFQRARLEVLRGEGVHITATSIWESPEHFTSLLALHGQAVDAWEVWIPDGRPSVECLQALATAREAYGIPIGLAPVITGERVEGKQHARTRRAFRPEELAQLDAWFGECDVHVDRVVCLPPELDAEVGPLQRIGGLDLLVQLSGDDDEENAHRVARALLQVESMAPQTRVYVEPLVDLDRTMDVTHGLLDTVCNPRPAFNVLRTLNSLLFASRASLTLRANTDDADSTSSELCAVTSTKSRYVFIPSTAMGTTASSDRSAAAAMSGLPDEAQVTLYNLVQATSIHTNAREARARLERGIHSDPWLLVTPRG